MTENPPSVYPGRKGHAWAAIRFRAQAIDLSSEDVDEPSAGGVHHALLR